MTTENSVQKRSFFRGYFFYRLKKLIGIIAATTACGLVFTTLYEVLCYSFVRKISISNDESIMGEVGLYMPIVGMAATIILCVVSAILSFNFYTSRKSMDMIGCLPLTYSQRFWGDFLSGLSAVLAPYIVTSLISVVPMNMTQKLIASDTDKFEYVTEYYLFSHNGSVTAFGVRMFFILLIIYASTYSLTALVTSCCGKKGSAVLYSIIAIPILPAILLVFGMFMLDYVKGAIASNELVYPIAVFAPGGTLMSLYLGLGSDSSNLTLMLNHPLVMTIMILYIIAMIVGAYFIGKSRKAEKVGSSFVNNVAYHVLSLLMVVMVIGVYISANSVLGLTAVKMIIGIVIALVFYLILELVQNHGLKRIVSTLIRFACVAVVGFGVAIIVEKTDAFHLENNLPNQSSIDQVEVGGYYFYGRSYEEVNYIYRDSEAISTILADNKRLIESDKIFTGYIGQSTPSIRIIYKLKNGSEVARYYQGDEDLIGEISGDIQSKPAFDIPGIESLDVTDFSNIRITGNIYSEDSSALSFSTSIAVKRSKYEEFISILKNDIMTKSASGYDDQWGSVDIWHTDSAYRDYDIFFIYKSYTDTIAFLSNPDNLSDGDSDSVEYYTIYWYLSYEDDYYYDDDYYDDFELDYGERISNVRIVSLKIYTDTESEYVKELITLIETETNCDDPCADFGEIMDNNYTYYYISNDNADRALELMIKIIAEQANAT